MGIVVSPHVGDIGTAFEYQCLDQDGKIIDVSTATVHIIFTRPDDTTFTVPAWFITDGKDGWVQYVTQSANDLHLPGLWRGQVYIIIGLSQWHSTVTQFRVLMP